MKEGKVVLLRTIVGGSSDTNNFLQMKKRINGETRIKIFLTVDFT